MTWQVEVNGPGTAPVYQFLKSQQGQVLVSATSTAEGMALQSRRCQCCSCTHMSFPSVGALACLRCGFSECEKLRPVPLLCEQGADISWNFEKFLVDKGGKVVKRYSPSTSPLAIEVSVPI